MQSTGQAGRHLSQPLHSSGTITTSAPWLKIAPNWSGQWRRQASQLMHSDISIRSGGFFHLGFRSCASMRSSRVPAATAAERSGRSTAPRVVAYDAAPQQVHHRRQSVADKYPFLSDSWFDAASKLIADHGGAAPP